MVNATKVLVIDGKEYNEYKIQSYRDYSFDVKLILSTVDEEQITSISDYYPKRIQGPEFRDIKIVHNTQRISDDWYSVTAEEDLDGGVEMIIEFTQPLIGKIIFEYEIFIEGLPPTPSRIELQCNYESDQVYSIESVPILHIEHLRIEVDMAKTTFAVDFEGKNAYEIELEIEVMGTNQDMVIIYDLIPSGFILTEDTIKCDEYITLQEIIEHSDGLLYIWKIKDMKVMEPRTIAFIVVEEDPKGETRALFTVYKD
ncbi:MAG: hypothetical protein INQ03_17590 [Candidatus Heimdallarchaeota archaeon]|nr:hypothetical protein [Candidatus Heimdallarchaeota archaeon]